MALVGPSGGGKTTILNLIPRFYDATAGRVTDRRPGRARRDPGLAAPPDRPGHPGAVPVRRHHRAPTSPTPGPSASDAEVEAAAKAAAAHDFIGDLPEGYDTRSARPGPRLSGGQRQRIAIARAFLKDAPILLLDEATSALDTESEAQVQAALERLMAGRTTILIAHRLSTVRGADRIHVIDRGRIVETGDHDSLVKAGGLYARLAKSQDLEAETPA